MPVLERSHHVDIEIDGLVDLAGLEEAAMDFARRAPGELVASAVEAMAAELLDIVVGPRATGCAVGTSRRRRGRARGVDRPTAFSAEAGGPAGAR